MPDFESGAFSRALPPLRFCLQPFTGSTERLQSAGGRFNGTCAPGNPFHRRLLETHAQASVPIGHLCRPEPEKFSDYVQIHAGHDQSNGECVAIAMPRVILKPRPIKDTREPPNDTCRRVVSAGAGTAGMTMAIRAAEEEREHLWGLPRGRRY